MPPDFDRIADALDRALALEGTAREGFLATLPPAERAAIHAGLTEDPFLDAPEAARAALIGPPEASGGGAAGEAPDLGVRLGPYRLEALVGEGGMGRVYRARRADGAFEQTVAVKVVRQSLTLAGADVAARLRRERDLLAALDHPGIARLIGGGETADGVPYLVTEFVRGEPLTAYADARGLGVRERARLLADVARAVDHAHRRFVVHRDLKPSNVLVAEREGPGGARVARPVVLDFGIAKLLDEASGEGTGAFPLTRTGMRLLTPAYAAPELFDPTGGVTTAADVYGLGALLYELLTGLRPHGETGAAPTTEPVRPSRAVTTAASGDGASGDGASGAAAAPEAATRARALRGDLDVICLRALHADPARRYPSAAALADDLERFLEGRPVEARRDSAWYVAGRFARRHRAAVAAGAVAVLALVVGLGVSVAALGEARAEAARAEEAAELLGGLLSLGNVAEVEGRVPTARSLLDSALVRTGGVESDELRAYLLSVVARAFDANEDPLRADSLLGAMMASLEGADVAPALRAEVTYQYAVAHADVGGTAAGLDLMERAEREAEPGTALHVRTVNGLSWLLRSHGREGEGLEQARRALRLARALPPAEAPEAEAEAYRQIGWSLSGLDRWDEAVQAFEQGWALQRRRHGAESLQSAEAAQSLGTHYERVGRTEDAGRARRLVLRVYRRTFGPDHHRVAAALGSMADQLMLEGDLAGAEAMYDEASGALLAAHGVDRWFVPRRFVQLAEVRHELGRYPEAEAAARRAAEIYTAKADTLYNSYSHGNALVALGRALAAQARAPEAEAAYRRALHHLHGNTSNVPPSHPESPVRLRREARRALASGG